MEKTGRKNRRYSTGFKMCVIMDMREHRLSYHETVRKHWGTKTHSEDCKYINVVKRWESIFLEEGAESLMKEGRGKVQSRDYILFYFHKSKLAANSGYVEWIV